MGTAPGWSSKDALLDIAPLQLLRRKVVIEALTARSVVLRRLPPRNQQAAAPIQLPVRVLLQRFVIEDLALDQTVPGAPRLTIDGSGSVASAADVQATLLMTAPAARIATAWRWESAMGMIA